MIIKSFIELTMEEKQKLYNYIISIGSNYSFDSFKEMVKDYIGIVFNCGESHFSLWDDGEIKGTLAVITKNVEENGEAFLTCVNIREEDKGYFTFLLKRGMKYISTIKPKIVKLGIYTGISYLIPCVLDFGFKEVYKAMIMKHEENSGYYMKFPDEVEFINISKENKMIFQQIHNDAFINSPNGSILTDDQMEELMNEYRQCPHMAGLMYYKGRPAGIYELSIKNDVGWIDGIGIAPEFQGKGLGKILLYKAMDILYTSGTKEVKLFVISSNERAVKLYEKNGFVKEKVTSTWFEKRLT
ncbi:GNAT family N-acetyltransferase [Fonticella tunisiensis]|uniref:Acetyltransferase (GNAT) family protein n=1 Tax=Fonticella tunisiensis TaxID=1096341 RepID=A0A4R7KP07_9CLOT|nr:GNAT family N-acetyltransferase [Fonticella tunisiensis]TDT57293.1 acetyltransferase (GNAT) family protein [Fonticella tunisiensis]